MQGEQAQLAILAAIHNRLAEMTQSPTRIHTRIDIVNFKKEGLLWKNISI